MELLHLVLGSLKMTLSKERKAYLTKIANEITNDLVKELKVNEWSREQKQNFKKVIIEAEKNLK
tara:strand:- start:528 stop:719 length:192 start_codon:yes stop_codon:yes gene_type:complete